MGRPKTYSDNDIINIAIQLFEEGKQPSGWYIKEQLGRGKIASIQSDLERLIKDGKIPEIPEQQKECDSTNSKVTTYSYELPVELQAILETKEQALYAMLRSITTELNDKNHLYYETLIAARIQELDVKARGMENATLKADELCSDLENRLEKQVMKNEELEAQVEELHFRIVGIESEKSELISTIKECNQSLNRASENATAQQNALSDLSSKLLNAESGYKENVVKLEFANNEIVRLKANISSLSDEYDKSMDELVESAAELKSTRALLNRSDEQLLASEIKNRDLYEEHRELQLKFKESENRVVTLLKRIDFFEEQLKSLQVNEMAEERDVRLCEDEP